MRAQRYSNLKFISKLVVIFGVPVSASIALILYIHDLSIWHVGYDRLRTGFPRLYDGQFKRFVTVYRSEL